MLTRLLVLGGALILVGSLQTWVIYSLQPLFGWTYPSGLDLGFGILTALAGIGILVIGARPHVERRRSARIAVGLAVVAFGVLGLALVLAANPDESTGRGFDGIGLGAIVVALGAAIAAFAGWRMAIRPPKARDSGRESMRPLWQGGALLVGGLLLWTEGLLFVSVLLWHAATGDSGQGPDFLGVGIEAWAGYFGVSGHDLGWDVAYLAFLPIAVASLVCSLALLRGRERAALVVAVAWFIEAFLFSVGDFRVSGFLWTQVIILVLIAAGAWPHTLGFARWLVGRPDPHESGLA